MNLLETVREATSLEVINGMTWNIDEITAPKMKKFTWPIKKQYPDAETTGQINISMPGWESDVIGTVILSISGEIKSEERIVDPSQNLIIYYENSGSVTIEYDDYPFEEISDSFAEQRTNKWVIIEGRLRNLLSDAKKGVSDRIRGQVESQLKYLWSIGEDEYFEDGMENKFFREIGSFISKFGPFGLESFYDLYCKTNSNLEVISESLKYFGRMEDQGTEEIRFCLLVHHLKHPSYRIKDAAVIGLVHLNDQNAIGYLQDIFEDEVDVDFLNDLEQAIMDLIND